MIELLPFGIWSNIYQNLSSSKDKKQIAASFDLSPTELDLGWHCLTY